MPRAHAAAALAVLVAVAIGLVRLGGGAGPAPEAAAPPPIRVTAAGGGQVLVHVAGAVRRPGVYRLREGARVDDALRRAGGPARRADLAAVNLAAEVQDGRQVLVPERPARGPGGAAPAGGPGRPATPAVVPGGAPGIPLNLNTATLEQLDALPGIGPATAQKILDHRETAGGFGSVEELGQVPGIGEKRMSALREAVTV